MYPFIFLASIHMFYQFFKKWHLKQSIFWVSSSIEGEKKVLSYDSWAELNQFFLNSEHY